MLDLNVRRDGSPRMGERDREDVAVVAEVGMHHVVVEVVQVGVPVVVDEVPVARGVGYLDASRGSGRRGCENGHRDEDEERDSPHASSRGGTSRR
ncbi:MAG: hypothetical protein M3134_00455 [Actinomycetota bacterium]|nr:hypothetical protein [Actinomycetota bacterium]